MCNGFRFGVLFAKRHLNWTQIDMETGVIFAPFSLAKWQQKDRLFGGSDCRESHRLSEAFSFYG